MPTESGKIRYNIYSLEMKCSLGLVSTVESWAAGSPLVE